MANDPVYVTFEFRGNLEDEIEKVTLGVKGLRDESAKTYQRLIADSSTAFGSMSADNRKLAVTIQENINALRDLSAVQKALDGELEAGNITTQQYTKSKAAMAVQEGSLREAISSGMQALNERIRSEKQAVDSVMALQKRLQELTAAYYNLSKAEREGATGQGILKQIGDIDKQITAAQSRMSAYSRTAGTGFNSLSMSVQQVARELPSLTMGANMFFLAISNNLPILADNLKQARVEYDLMKKSGQTAVPVWKQVLSSIMSWQTALVVGITLLSVYGKDIINWIQGLFGADQAQKRLNESMTEFNTLLSKSEQEAKTLFSALERTKAGTEGHRKAINDINAAYGKYLPSLLSEKSTLNEINTAYQLVNKSLRENAALKAQSNTVDKVLEKAIKTQAEAMTEMRNIAIEKLGSQEKTDGILNTVASLTEGFRTAGKTWQEAWQGVSAKIQSEIGNKKLGGSFYEELEDYVRSIYKSEKEISDIQKQFNPFFNKEQADKAVVQNKAYWEDIKKQAASVLESIDADQKKLLDQGKTGGIEPAIVTAYKNAKSEIDKATAALKAYDSYDKKQSTADKQQSKEQKAQEAANAIKAETAMRELEIERQKKALAQKEKDAELELRQQKINIMKDGTDKELAQITLNYDRKINEIEKKGQEYILAQQKIEQAQWENANPNWKKKGLVFKPKTTAVSQLPAAQGKELSDATLTADNAREKAEADLLEKTLKQYQDYATKRLEVERKYNEDVAYLTAQRTETNKAAIDAAIAEAAKGKQKALSELSLDELKDTDMWAKMFGDLDKMAMPSLEALLKQAKAVNTSAWDPENVKEYQDAIERLEEAIRTRSPFKSIAEDWKKLLRGIKEGSKDDIADALAGIDTAAQKINGDLDTIAGGIGDIFGDEAGYAAEQVAALTSALGGFATGAAKIAKGDIIGGIASVVSSIGSIFAMGKKVKEMNRQAREEVQKYYDTAIEGEREYQLLLRERQRTHQETGESTLAYNKRITTELTKQQRESAEEYARLMAEIQGEGYISGKGYKHGTWFRKAKTWDIYSSLAGKSYEDIEKLYTEGKLDEKVSKLFEQLQKLKEEGADINQMLADQKEAMREALTGTTTDGIADSIIRGFAEGKRSAADFADSFQEMLNNAVLQGIKMKALEEPLRKWYESFAEASGNGLTEANIADLKAQYDKIIEDAAKQLEDMEKVTGTTVGDIGRQAAAKGLAAAMTQDSANELNGNFNAMLVYLDKTSTGVTNINSLLVEGLTVMNRIAANTDRLENIEKDIRTMRNGVIDMINKGLLIRKTA